MKIIMLGAQGTGKGTQGALLAEKLNCNFVSLGDILREDPIVRAKLADGELLSDAEVDGIALKYLKGEAANPNSTPNSTATPDKADTQTPTPISTPNLVFDGYPRRKSQAETLVRENALPDLILEIVVPEEEIIERMLLRGRNDDTREAIRRRLDQYHAERDAIIAVLQSANVKIIQVDGLGTPEEVFARIEKLV